MSRELVVMYAVLSVLLLWAGAVAWSSHQIGDVLDGERAGARWGESTGAGESLWGGGGARRALLAVQAAHHTGRDRQRPPAGRNPKPPLATGRVNATARKARKTQAAHDKWRAFFTSQFCQLPVVKYNTADHEYLDRPVVGAPPTQPLQQSMCMCSQRGCRMRRSITHSDECWWRRERRHRGHTMMTGQRSRLRVGWV